MFKLHNAAANRTSLWDLFPTKLKRAKSGIVAFLAAASLAGCLRSATLALTTGIPLPAPTAATAPTATPVPEEKFPEIAATTTTEDTAAVVTFAAPFKTSALECSATYLSYTSSNTNLVAASGALTLSGTFPDCTATLQPVANASGTTTIGLTFSYENKTLSTEFVLTVSAVNDVPSITSIANQSTVTNVPVTNIGFTIGDTENTGIGCASAVSKSSTNTALLPIENIAIVGSGTTCTMSLTPTTAIGESTVTLSVNDGGGGIVSGSFTFTVSPTAVQVSNTSWQDADLRTGFVSGSYLFTLSEPTGIALARLFFADSDLNLIGTTPLASTTSITASMALALPASSLPVGATKLVLVLTAPSNYTVVEKTALAITDRTMSDISQMSFWVAGNSSVLNAAGSAATHGEKIATWVDQSGNSRSLLQTIDARRPIYQTSANTLNSLPTLLFGGGWWSGGENFSLDWSYSLPATAMIVAKFSGATAGQHSLLGSQNDGELFYDLNAGWLGPNMDNGVAPTAPATWCVYALRWGSSVFTAQYCSISHTSTYTVPGTPYTKFYLGSRGAAGWNGSNPVQYFNGLMAEALMFSRALTDAEIEQIKSYLSTKYGL